MNRLHEIDKITALIVDDELHGRENLKKILSDYCSEIEVVGVAESVLKAIEFVKGLKPDVVFLDINMPVLDGFDFLTEIAAREFMVVFVSAHEEFGIKAVKAGAVDYILKPINIKELKQTVKKLLTLHSQKITHHNSTESNKLILPVTHGFEVLIIDNIIRLEADGCYTKVIVKEGKNLIISRTLKDFEDTLPKEIFYRIHKSHIISLKFIKEYSGLSGHYVTMFDGSKIEISRRRAPEFTKKIKSVIKTV
jgi:two-component system LytT family response regulator